MRFCRMSAVILAFAAIESYGAVNVTASREYVDRKVTSVSNSIMDEVSSNLRKIESIEDNTYTKDETDEKVGAKQDKLPYPTNAIPYSSISGVPAAPVTSVNGKTGSVTIGKSDVDLGNVANTGDSATPVSGGTTKFTTGGAYTHLAKKQDKLPYPTNAIPPSAIYNPPWLTSFTESDPTIYPWAKAQTKPSYTWTEIGSKPSFAAVATSGAYYDLTDKPDLSKLLLIEDFDEWQTNSNIIIGRDNTWSESSDGIILVGHDSTVEGEHAMAVGPYAIANGDFAMAFGTSEAKADYAVALGFNNLSLASEAFAGGLFSQAFFSWGSAVGYKAVSSNNYASAFGAFAEATGPQALALGPAKAMDLNSIGIGTFAEAQATNTIAIGSGAKAKAYLGTAIGTLAEAEENGLAIGYNSYAGPGSVALGMGRRPTSIFGIYGSQAFGTRTYALGGHVASNVTDSVSIGTYAWNTNSRAVVISAGFNTVNGPETRSHGDGTITLGVTNGLHDVWIGTNTLDEAISMDYAKKSESLSPDTMTNAVRSVVSVTSSYIWDAQEECLYRREMKAGYLYWTPVTNVNALLPENISVLNYLEEHKND